ncbi:hypothetical protein IO90_08465 [Chryseobacterium sp. FH1]|nr:hypothetical protein IO90_08465 [Chryseobacterium sp. FH1]
MGWKSAISSGREKPPPPAGAGTPPEEGNENFSVSDTSYKNQVRMPKIDPRYVGVAWFVNFSFEMPKLQS